MFVVSGAVWSGPRPQYQQDWTLPAARALRAGGKANEKWTGQQQGKGQQGESVECAVVLKGCCRQGLVLLVQ